MFEESWVATAAGEYRAGRALALLFDYDGTLTPIVPHPSQALLPAATRDTLAALSEVPRVHLGILSGRAIRELRELICLPHVLYAGSSGMQLDVGGIQETDPSFRQYDQNVQTVIDLLAEPLRRFPGAWIEPKPGCLSVHYRKLAPELAAPFRGMVHEAFATGANETPPLRLRDVSRAIEIHLTDAWDKGHATQRMLDTIGADALPIYASDAANDEEAVALVNARGGLTIGVGDESPAAASFRAPTTEDFAADLNGLLGALRNGRQAS